MPTQLLQRTAHRFVRAVDRVVLERVLTPTAADLDPIETLAHPERMAAMAAFSAFYDRPEHYSTDSGFFTRAERIAPHERRRRGYRGGGEVLDLSWTSAFEPLWSAAAARERFESLLSQLEDRPDLPARSLLERSVSALELAERRLGLEAHYGVSTPENRTMHARWFRHLGAPRPCAVILHGYLGGRLAVEERMWPIETLFDRGFDVVLTVLPLHGIRASAERRFRLPGFPASDPRLAIEGFRHLVHDHLSLFDYLLAGRVSALGVMGMSLGGYSSALLCTIDPRIRFGVFYMPLASIAEFASRTGRMVGTESEQRQQATALDLVYRPVSPFARASRLPEQRAIVVAGQADLITGVGHAERLAEHFGALSSTFNGGHILALGRDAAFDPVWQMLRTEGLMDRRQNGMSSSE